MLNFSIHFCVTLYKLQNILPELFRISLSAVRTEHQLFDIRFHVPIRYCPNNTIQQPQKKRDSQHLDFLFPL